MLIVMVSVTASHGRGAQTDRYFPWSSSLPSSAASQRIFHKAADDNRSLFHPWIAFLLADIKKMIHGCHGLSQRSWSQSCSHSWSNQNRRDSWTTSAWAWAVLNQETVRWPRPINKWEIFEPEREGIHHWALSSEGHPERGRGAQRCDGFPLIS